MHKRDDSLTQVSEDAPVLEESLADEPATMEFGVRFSKTLKPGVSIWLQGDLGAGKTTLARGVLRGLGFVGRVKSPTYTLVELYPFSLFNLYHFDLYRITDQNEWEDAGFREYFNPASVCLVEWPEKAGDLLPDPDVEISLQFVGEGGEGGRVVTVVGLTEAGRACIAQLLS